MNWKHKDIRCLPVVLKHSETSHGSTNFHFAESGKELESTFLSPTRSSYSSGWELKFLTENCNFPCGNWNWYCTLINLRVCRRHDTQLDFVTFFFCKYMVFIRHDLSDNQLECLVIEITRLHILDPWARENLAQTAISLKLKQITKL